jgi:hypothetical protein
MSLSSRGGLSLRVKSDTCGAMVALIRGWVGFSDHGDENGGRPVRPEMTFCDLGVLGGDTGACLVWQDGGLDEIPQHP